MAMFQTAVRRLRPLFVAAILFALIELVIVPQGSVRQAVVSNALRWSSGPAESDTEYMQKMLQWKRPMVPGPSHWPPYEWFVGKEYDPNRWEGFSKETRLYTQTASEKSTARPYMPYPEYNSKGWRKKWRGQFTPCKGPSGLRLNGSTEDMVKAHNVKAKIFPKPMMGSLETIGLESNICFDRKTRYGPYGFVEAGSVAGRYGWEKINWQKLQDDCIEDNKSRFSQQPKKVGLGNLGTAGPSNVPQYRKRTAILLRCFEGYPFSENDMQAIRALITEASLGSGGEYQVFLLYNIKEPNDTPISQNLYGKLLEKHIPPELQSITIFWNEKMMENLYPKMEAHYVYFAQFMCVQWFWKEHPEFDFVWNWEMDVRYIGNHFDFLERVAEFANRQPRKYLWERSSKYYIPEHHGSYSQYSKWVERDIAASDQRPIWGPVPHNFDLAVAPLGPKPPHSFDADKYTWGVGEEADLITLLPFFNPEKTDWVYSNYTYNLNQTIPRLVSIGTVVRLSNKLLDAMHRSNDAGQGMYSELWPHSAALLHGMKAVCAPHPIWTDHKWPARYANLVFNAPDEKDTYVYQREREYNFAGSSWYYMSDFTTRIFRRFLGYKVPLWEGEVPEDQRICLPSMMLHPVKTPRFSPPVQLNNGG